MSQQPPRGRRGRDKALLAVLVALVVLLLVGGAVAAVILATDDGGSASAAQERVDDPTATSLATSGTRGINPCDLLG